MNWIQILTSRRDDLDSGYKYWPLSEMAWTLHTSMILFQSSLREMTDALDTRGDELDSGYKY